jgi:hypothetical protein
VLSAAPKVTSRARLIAAVAPSSAAFLQAVPICYQWARVLMTRQCGLLSLFVLALQLVRRINVSASQSTPLVCTVSVAAGQQDLSPDSALTDSAAAAACQWNYGAALTDADVPSRLEPRGLTRDDGKRPDGVTTMPWKYGRCLALLALLGHPGRQLCCERCCRAWYSSWLRKRSGIN